MTRVEGAEILKRQLQSLGTGAFASRATEEASDVIVSAIRTEAPQGVTGNLRRGISSRWAKHHHPHVISRIAGVNVAQKGTRDSASHTGGYAAHGHLVALGTDGRTTRTGAWRGAMPANNFVMRGFRRAEITAVSRFETTAGADIRKAIS